MEGWIRDDGGRTVSHLWILWKVTGKKGGSREGRAWFSYKDYQYSDSYLFFFFFTRGASLNACIHSSYIHAKEAVIYEGVNGFVKT